MPSLTVAGLTGLSYDSAVVDFENGYVWGYNSTYTWHVDSVNQFGTTVGDNRTFASIGYKPPTSIMRYRADGSIVPAGTTYNEVTMYFTGENFMGNIGRLVAACGNALWYETITS